MDTFYNWVFDKNNDLNKMALSTIDKSHTYGELKKEVDKYKVLLSEHGDLRGKRIGIIIPSVFYYSSLFMAVNMLGGTVIPINAQLRKGDLSSILELTEPHIIFTIEETKDTNFREVVRNWSLSSGKKIIMYCSKEYKVWNKEVQEGLESELDEEKIDVIGCSSGSTGIPKGMMINMEAWSYWLKRITEGSSLSEDDKVFSIIPITAPYGITWLFSCLKEGLSLVIPERFDVFQTVMYLKENQCNKIVSTPSVFKSLYMFIEKVDKSIFKSINMLVFAGEVISESFINDLEELKQCDLIGLYGLSEQGLIMWSLDLKEPGWEIGPEVGFKMTEDNELVFHSPAALTGYYRNEQLTKEVMRDGWFYTGDLGVMLDNGRIQIVGRKKDMIKKGGQQIIPGEIENFLLTHKHIKQAVIIGVPHEIFGEKVVAFIVGDAQIEISELYTFCKSSMAQYKVPDEIYQLKEFPMNLGKVDKLALRNMG
ncbi:class I adenylate-forming enzyme family protein [Domibacillus epiphyticus]|uniref:AMP-dependent synthetase n=1 Tax=Domibacillus epiphyticus TaxID=1714355 RepID=A0A1V2A934_9BACI|nr:class I adenylate-forming enzyme family protein [Domibacillus epiphyticus]OMP67508.1 hypothetical protein BTO28_06050 [Domibacillus epiphyticus]